MRIWTSATLTQPTGRQTEVTWTDSVRRRFAARSRRSAVAVRYA
jgi:hypothetical protein